VSLYGLLATALHRFPAEVGEMDLTDVNELLEYWEKVPPLHIMVAGYLGVGKKKEEKSTMTAEQFAAMLGAKIPPPKAADPAPPPAPGDDHGR
jgi:hypothetical protein